MQFFKTKFISLVLIFTFNFSVLAEEKIYYVRKKTNVKSDKLTIDSVKNYAKFFGNVTAEYDNIFISTDTLNIYYNKVYFKEKIYNKVGIKKIVAIGNVKIKTEKYSGYANNAEYIVESEKLILYGEICKFVDNENLIEGSRIVLNKKTGNITVEGSSKNRVKTIFFP